MTYDRRWAGGAGDRATEAVGYATFLDRKAQHGSDEGFAPVWLPSSLFPFQVALTEWALRRGRAALFADCGLGKTPMQLAWAENVVRHTNGRVLILTPLAVGPQTVAEGAKFGIEVHRSRGAVPAGAGIVVTNYEMLHQFSPTDFDAVVCDESSALKHFSGATQKTVTRFMSKTPYRLLCTATAAPNDYIELGTSSEALGFLGHSDMLARFFKQDQKKPHRYEDIKQWRAAQEANQKAGAGGARFAKLSFRVAQTIGQWRLKGHAEVPFWRWVASWARACRKPSDLGFPDAGFALPPLIEREHVIEPARPPDGMLFSLPAFGLHAEREERRRTIKERVDLVADLVASHDYSVIWCQMNAEGDALERRIYRAVQVAGKDSPDYKEAAAEWFSGRRCICDDPQFAARLAKWPASPGGGCKCGFTSGPRRLVTKSKIFGLGLNWPHCAHVVTFVTHSYEGFYQSVRRCWRFGQTRPVTVDIIATTGEAFVRENMQRKAAAAALMFERLIEHMRDGLAVEAPRHTKATALPSWLAAKELA